MPRATLATLIVLIVSVQNCYGKNDSDSSELGRVTNFFIPRTCADPPLKQLFTGVHDIQPEPGFGSTIEVLCDQTFDKGGWIVIQNRLDGSAYFNREWLEYQIGFGNLKGEFWLGLDKIHEITYSQKCEVVFLLTDWDNNVKYAKYDEFRVAGPEQKYAITELGSYSGDADDAFSASLGAPFSTVDNDNSGMAACPGTYKGAWWYPDPCGDSNLNGLYVSGGTGGTAMEVNFWAPIVGNDYGLKASRIMIRPKKELM